MSYSEPIVTEKALAQTYDGGRYEDAWVAVQQYRRVGRHRARNPDDGYRAIARTSRAGICKRACLIVKSNRCN